MEKLVPRKSTSSQTTVKLLCRWNIRSYKHFCVGRSIYLEIISSEYTYTLIRFSTHPQYPQIQRDDVLNFGAYEVLSRVTWEKKNLTRAIRVTHSSLVFGGGTCVKNINPWRTWYKLEVKWELLSRRRFACKYFTQDGTFYGT